VGSAGGDGEVIVVGGGIAGLGAAVRLKDRGFEPLVLEAEARVGGRMTTDRVNGFVIDRGVTLFGNGFASMRALVQRLELSQLVRAENLAWAFRMLPAAADTAEDGLKICCWTVEFLCARESRVFDLAWTWCAIIARSGMGTVI
jgi:phytoene dehydrogenase-like protein